MRNERLYGVDYDTGEICEYVQDAAGNWTKRAVDMAVRLPENLFECSRVVLEAPYRAAESLWDWSED